MFDVRNDHDPQAGSTDQTSMLKLQELHKVLCEDQGHNKKYMHGTQQRSLQEEQRTPSKRYISLSGLMEIPSNMKPLKVSTIPP